jgi:citrate synthase
MCAVGSKVFHRAQNGRRSFQSVSVHILLICETCPFKRASTGKDELLETAMALHDAAMNDEFFIKRKLAPNVDFWSGLIYRAMGPSHAIQSLQKTC